MIDFNQVLTLYYKKYRYIFYNILTHKDTKFSWISLWLIYNYKTDWNNNCKEFRLNLKNYIQDLK